MNNQPRNNATAEYKNPFIIASEVSMLVNAMSEDEKAEMYLEEEPAGFWANFISIVKPKNKSDHEKLKETYQDVKKMANSYINEDLDEQDYIKKFII